MTAKHLLDDGVADLAPVLGKSLLQRVLLPRSGEPLDVRTLYLEEAKTNARRAHSLSRTSLAIGAESEVSFCTYFGAFPASYWRRYSVLTSVVLRVEVSGHCRIDVYRSKADSSRIHVEGREAVDGDAA
ncbi:MAG: glycosyltransferase family 2 protein, partial [Rhodococcus sp. (in: high G+C Gram-positive bacteria)]